MIVKRSDMAWITVADIAKAKKLFVDILGMEVQADAFFLVIYYSLPYTVGGFMFTSCSSTENIHEEFVSFAYNVIHISS